MMGEALDSDVEDKEEEEEHVFISPIGLVRIGNVESTAENLVSHATQLSPTLSSGGGSTEHSDKVHYDNIKGNVRKPKRLDARSITRENMGPRELLPRVSKSPEYLRLQGDLRMMRIIREEQNQSTNIAEEKPEWMEKLVIYKRKVSRIVLYRNMVASCQI